MATMILTQKLVDSLKCEAGSKKLSVFDKGCKNLVLETSNTGRKTYYFRYQDDRNVTRQPKLSDANSITLKQARTLCDRYRSKLAMGENPWAEKAELKRVPKLETFIWESFLPFIKTYKRSWDTDQSLLKNHIVPTFGHLYMDQLNKKHVIDFIGKHLETHAPGSVNRVIILLRYIYNCAIRWETAGITKNPTNNIPLLEENNKKERFLSKEEAEKLLGAIQKSPNKMLQYIVPMLILTGARKNEVINAKWEDINFEQRVWRIPMSKSGKARHVPISDGVEQLLSNVPAFDGCDLVFPNPKTLKPYVSFYYAWDTARKSVGLGDVRVHDLRHSFASFLVNAGRSLYEVQKILGHTQIKTTQRYAHLSQESLLSAANAVSNAVPIAHCLPNKIHDVPLLQIASQ
jgi:integrase